MGYEWVIYRATMSNHRETGQKFDTYSLSLPLSLRLSHVHTHTHTHTHGPRDVAYAVASHHVVIKASCSRANADKWLSLSHDRYATYFIIYHDLYHHH